MGKDEYRDILSEMIVYTGIDTAGNMTDMTERTICMEDDKRKICSLQSETFTLYL
jgi:hypothetical protein